MKTFYEMIRILESEQIKTPGGYTLTPEELEDYENEKSPMYKAIFLKDIDAKRRMEQGRPSAEIEAKIKKKQEEENKEKERLEKEKQDKTNRENRIRTKADSIIDNTANNFIRIISVIGKVLEQKYGLKEFKSILSIQLGDFGLRTKGWSGDKGFFDEKLHEPLDKKIKKGDPVILKSDLLMYMDDPIVIQKAKVSPLNFQEEYQSPEEMEEIEAINIANKHIETISLKVKFLQKVLDCINKATSVNSLSQMLLDVLRNFGVKESDIKEYLELYNIRF